MKKDAQARAKNSSAGVKPQTKNGTPGAAELSTTFRQAARLLLDDMADALTESDSDEESIWLLTIRIDVVDVIEAAKDLANAAGQEAVKAAAAEFRHSAWCLKQNFHEAMIGQEGDTNARCRLFVIQEKARAMIGYIEELALLLGAGPETEAAPAPVAVKPDAWCERDFNFPIQPQEWKVVSLR